MELAISSLSSLDFEVLSSSPLDFVAVSALCSLSPELVLSFPSSLAPKLAVLSSWCSVLSCGSAESSLSLTSFAGVGGSFDSTGSNCDGCCLCSAEDFAVSSDACTAVEWEKDLHNNF